MERGRKCENQRERKLENEGEKSAEFDPYGIEIKSRRATEIVCWLDRRLSTLAHFNPL